MPPCGVVKKLNVIEDIRPCLIPCLVDPSSNPLPLQEVEEALCTSVVVAVSSSTHTRINVVLPHIRLELNTGVLGALI